MKLLDIFTIFTSPVKHLVYPQESYISKLSSISLMMTAYPQEKLKTILVQILWTM